MYSEPLEKLLDAGRLREAAQRYRTHPAFPSLREMIDSGRLLRQIHTGDYRPGAATEFDIPKHDGAGSRTLSVAPLRDRVVAKALADALTPLFRLSDRSYAYRQGKGPVKAVRRVLDELRRGYIWILRGDVASYFDTIDQERLLRRLSAHFTDPRIPELVALLVTKGSLRGHRYRDHLQGIHQGDPLSPLLANVYLDPFDRRLEEEGIPFVRYGDDFILLGRKQEDVARWQSRLEEWLAPLGLRPKAEKTRLGSVLFGFEYLGLYFHRYSVRIERSRLEEKIRRLHQDTRHLDLYDTLKLLGERVEGFDRYYRQVLTDLSQLEALQAALDEVVIAKIAQARKQGVITRQQQFRNALSSLKSYRYTDETERKRHHDELIRRAYDLWRAAKDPMAEARRKTEAHKRDILREELERSELVLGRPGLYLGFSRGRAILKEKGKVVKTMPIGQLGRVLVLQRVSLSSEIVYQCARRGIDIDFVRGDEPYAQLTAWRSPVHTLARRQALGQNSRRYTAIGRDILRAKIRNQLNLLKYHARYRRKHDPGLYERLADKIAQIQRQLKRLPTLHDKEAIRGIEGVCGAIYWEGFGLLIGDPDYRRVTRDAPDAVNQALNYGYAILYHRIQSALLRARLDIYAPLFHEPAEGKPALVFDLIEEFRQGTVDREIIALLNRGRDLSTERGRLTPQSVEAVTGAIQSRLATPTLYHGARHQLVEIIQLQARALAKSLGGDARYHPFSFRY